MFTIPELKAIISIFFPVGEYRVTTTYTYNKRSKRMKATETVLPFFAARRRALGEVIECAYSVALEIGALAVGIFLGVRFLHWF